MPEGDFSSVHCPRPLSVSSEISHSSPQSPTGLSLAAVFTGYHGKLKQTLALCAANGRPQ